MAIDRSSLTPQQRLAISRRALFKELDYDLNENEQDGLDAQAGHVPQAALASHSNRNRGFLSGFPMLEVARNVGERWWRRHPANAMVQIARPLLARYAEKQPAKLVAYAAGTGALLVILRPWRLLSVTALAAAIFKTSDMADMVTSLMHENSSKTRVD